MAAAINWFTYSLAALANAVAWATGEVVDIVVAFEKWGNSGVFDSIREFASVVMQNFRDSLGGSCLSGHSKLRWQRGIGSLGASGQQLIIQDFTIFYKILGDLGVYTVIGAAIGFVVNGLLGFIDIISRVIIAVNGFERSFLTTIADILDSVGLVVPGAKDMADGIRDELAKLPVDVGASLDPALSNAVTGPVNKAGTDGKQASSEAVNGIADHWGVLAPTVKDKIDPSLSNFIVGEVTDAGNAGVTAAKTSVEDIVGEYGKMPGEVGNTTKEMVVTMRNHSQEAGSEGVKIAAENVIRVGQAYETLPTKASQAIAPLAPAIEHQVKIADGPSTAAAAATVQHTGTEFGKLPGMAGTQLAPLNQAVLAPINTTKLSSGTAVTGLVANVVANFVPLPMRAGSAVAPLGANTTPHFVSARTSARKSICYDGNGYQCPTISNCPTVTHNLPKYVQYNYLGHEYLHWIGFKPWFRNVQRCCRNSTESNGWTQFKNSFAPEFGGICDVSCIWWEWRQQFIRKQFIWRKFVRKKHRYNNGNSNLLPISSETRNNNHQQQCCRRANSSKHHILSSQSRSIWQGKDGVNVYIKVISGLRGSDPTRLSMHFRSWNL